MDFNGAESACLKLGAHLASVESEEDNGFVQSHKPAGVDIAYQMYLGAHNQATRGVGPMTWTDGTVLGYTNWAPGEPNNALNQEHCTTMRESGEWNDVQCASKFQFVCKKTLSTAEAATATLPEAVVYRMPFIMPKLESLEELGVGGLDKQIEEIFRRAFASRAYDPEMVTRLGIRHVKGLMIHGPPGTGKTLLARQISHILQAKKTSIVNGPEIMSKFVGQSESNIRGLFQEAEVEYKQWGSDSGLYVVIFDEVDAIMRARGSNTDDSAARAVYDGVTTQLLSIMDGMHSSDNVLVIGLTNRIELIDAALLRPGRFEVSIKMPLPDTAGRRSILRIHTRSLQQSGLLSPTVDHEDLVTQTNSYTGADIEGVVKSALSFALARAAETVDSVMVPRPIIPSSYTLQE